MTESAYYQQSRPEMLQFIPSSTQRHLDIGCSEGRFARAVKEKIPTCETWGVEINAEAAAEAARHVDKVFNGKVEDIDKLPSNYFDVISMNDVLEHIDYSEPVLEVVKDLLAPGGKLILSLPNVRYYLNIRSLVFGKDWEYQDYGVLDRTHLRFFTQKSASRLLEQNGFEVVETVGLNPPSLKLHYRALFALAPTLFSDMKYPQFAMVAQLVD